VVSWLSEGRQGQRYKGLSGHPNKSEPVGHSPAGEGRATTAWFISLTYQTQRKKKLLGARVLYAATMKRKMGYILWTPSVFAEGHQDHDI